ncbi:MAG: 1-acyl-sn-glycerol-3-phosphate acyltransferase, partial [Deltaproteobacteria bacterium]|nr:1-acyl-sn-glycerol-3-phosphate acyltransferase [Deltaproteobacteria bacterium]
KLYKFVLEQYVKILVAEGYPIEFFIEGTRSRTGKLQKPKMGVLSMLVKAWQMKAAPDIYFVPISINYEKIFEEKSYVEEMKGGAKKKENVRGVLQATRKFKFKYGKVFIRFAEPISLAGYMGENEVTREAVSDFAYELTYHINRVSVVTSTSLAAISLLSFAKRGIPHAEALERTAALHHYLEFKGATFSDIIRKPGEWAYAEALAKLALARVVTPHQDFQGNFYTVEETKRSVLDYHKNNSLHFFASLACFAKVLQTAGTAQISFADLEARYGRVKTLLDSEFTFSRRSGLETHLQKLIAFFKEEEWARFDAGSGVLEFGPALNHPHFKLYASLLDNFFESLYVTLLCVAHFPEKKGEKKKLELFILEKGKGPYLKGDLHYPEALSRFNVANSLVTLSSLGLIRIDEKGFDKLADEKEMSVWQKFIGELLSAGDRTVSLPIKLEALSENVQEPMNKDFH